MFEWIQKLMYYDDVPIDDIYLRLSDLEILTKELREKYDSLLSDVKRLEDENIQLTNTLYELESRLETKINNIHPVVYNIKSDV